MAWRGVRPSRLPRPNPPPPPPPLSCRSVAWAGPTPTPSVCGLAASLVFLVIFTYLSLSLDERPSIRSTSVQPSSLRHCCCCKLQAGRTLHLPCHLAPAARSILGFAFCLSLFVCVCLLPMNQRYFTNTAVPISDTCVSDTSILRCSLYTTTMSFFKLTYRRTRITYRLPNVCSPAVLCTSSSHMFFLCFPLILSLLLARRVLFILISRAAVDD